MNILYRFILHCPRFYQTNQRYIHYLSQANPIRQPKDLVSCILNNIIYHDEQIFVCNKPPGVIVLGINNIDFDDSLSFLSSYLDETWDRKIDITNQEEEEEEIEGKSSLKNSNPCTIQYHMPQFRMALKWDHFFPCIRTPNEPSGLLIYTQNSKLHDDIKSTAMRSFRKLKQPYLTFYGITTAIPRKLEDSHHIMIERHMYNGQYLSYEVFDASSNALKQGRIYTATIQHRTLSTNDELKVALVEFKTTTCTWDFVEIYCLRQCASLLGDNKYWNRVKLVAGIPMYINPIKHKIYPAKQQLTKHVRLALDLYGQQITCPLHLHLTDFNLPKRFRRQRAVVHYHARPFPYFYETLERLKLKFPDDLNMNKPFEQQVDQEFEDAINR
ncbi:unnamed protein product [Rotaria sordida]|uniref:Pseudouridine synthase RsuA/RluA-like domain-containing protein n=1 Tax=Rotaria sordida TaxID=392033 RepID=A0A819D970_9BILA|nr:unnamed protein product [Rotaria sordida]